MISIIICSRKKDVLAQFLASVERTIGAPYELVVVDNSQNAYNIFQAYNHGVSLAKGETLLFAHEDLIMRSEGWGAAIEKHMAADPQIGMIGVVGTQSLPKAPRGWSAWGMQGENYKPMCRLVQNVGDPKCVFEGDAGFCMTYHNPEGKDITQVMGVDGIMFAIRRELFDQGKVRFDEQTYSGFHVYDMDMSMQVAMHKKVMVLLDIELKHLSKGFWDRNYYVAYYKYYTKWKAHLPKSVHTLPDPAVFSQLNAATYFTRMAKSGFFTGAEIGAYARDYFETIKDERKTRYYYMVFYYAYLYHRFGVGRLASWIYKLIRKIFPKRKKTVTNRT